MGGIFVLRRTFFKSLLGLAGLSALSAATRLPTPFKKPAGLTGEEAPLPELEKLEGFTIGPIPDSILPVPQNRPRVEARGASSRQAAATRDSVLLQVSPVAGFQYYQGTALWPFLALGDRLDLVREPGNPYDEQAVRVEWKGCKLGYVPRTENATVAQMLDRGERLTARIAQLKDSPDPWERVRLQIMLTI